MDATRRALAVVERVKIEQVLKEADNVKGRAAELLQISYKMLLAKLKEHNRIAPRIVAARLRPAAPGPVPQQSTHQS